MPITAGNYNVVLKGKWDNNQDVINSFFFEVNLESGLGLGIENELFEVGKAMWNSIKSHLLGVTCAIVNYTQVDVFKADGADVGASGFYTIPSGEGVGSLVAEALPPFVSWTFQYTRPNANFRHGYKRFAGVPEEGQVKGLAVSPYPPLLTALANTLKADIPLGTGVGSAHMFPKLVQRVKNGMPVDPDVWYLPATVVYKRIGSQNSRKYSVGS